MQGQAIDQLITTFCLDITWNWDYYSTLQVGKLYFIDIHTLKLHFSPFQAKMNITNHKL